MGNDDVLVLDLEATDDRSPSEIAQWAQSFVKLVEPKNCWVYTTHSFIRDGACDGLYGHPLWIASLTGYGTPGDVKPWPVWTMQQYSWSPVDQNVFNGDAVTWGKLANAA